VFCPKKFVAISASNRARLAVTAAGGTVAANAISNAAAAALAWIAVCSACTAVPFIHAAYGAAAAVIDADAGPRHPAVSPETSEE
jgi:hypothetical protein